jgi:hypothetical protein
MPAKTVVASIDAANVTVNAVWTDARLPTGCVLAMVAVTGWRVRNAARAGQASGCPIGQRPACTETVGMPRAQVVFGEIVSVSPAASQTRSTGVGGST